MVFISVILYLLVVEGVTTSSDHITLVIGSHSAVLPSEVGGILSDTISIPPDLKIA